MSEHARWTQLGPVSSHGYSDAVKSIVRHPVNPDATLAEKRPWLEWQRLRAWGQNRLVRSSMIWIGAVPIAARVVLELRERVTEPEWAADFVQSLQLPFRWQVLFGTAVAFTLAHLLFDWRCPEVIKDHADVGSFKASRKQPQHLMRYAQRIAHGPEQIGRPLGFSAGRRIGTSQSLYLFSYPSEEKLPEKFHEFGLVKNGEQWADFADRDTEEVDWDAVFWAVFDAAGRHNPVALHVATAMFALGALGIGWIFSMNLNWVLRV